MGVEEELFNVVIIFIFHFSTINEKFCFTHIPGA